MCMCSGVVELHRILFWVVMYDLASDDVLALHHSGYCKESQKHVSRLESWPANMNKQDGQT